MVGKLENLRTFKGQKIASGHNDVARYGLDMIEKISMDDSAGKFAKDP